MAPKAKNLSPDFDFVTIATHQLRTPISALKWQLELLRDDKAGSLKPRQRQYIDDALLLCQRITKIINNLVLVAEIEKKKLHLRISRVEIGNIIKEILDEVSNLARAYNVSLINNCRKRSGLVIETDKDKIKLILSILVDNAIRYIKGKGKVKMDCRLAKNSLVITVTDTGIGIPDEEKNKVFEMFYRGNEAAKLQTEGTGLNLYIAKKIIKLLKGRIWYKSSPQGTAFKVSLPR